MTAVNPEPAASLRPAGWMPSPSAAILIGFACIVTGLLMSHQGRLVAPVYLAGALAIGGFLYFRSPGLYVGFTFWLYFLSPMLRRMVDYQTGWTDFSLVLLAPVLTAALAGLTLVRHAPELLRPAFFPFVLVICGIFYGYAVGVARVGPSAATFGLINWLGPVIFGLHIAINWRCYAQYRETVKAAFSWGALVMGTYGLVQFFLLPVWDAAWMMDVDMTSIGRPEPLLVRVFSTMNAPGPFAIVMMACLLMLFAAPGWVRWPAAVVGLGSLLLSLVRISWIGGALALLVLVMSVPARQRIYILAIAAAATLLAVPLMTVDEINNTITERLGTLGDVETDHSFMARLAFLGDAVGLAQNQIIGNGIGTVGSANRLAGADNYLSIEVFDNGVLELPFVLGWLGALFYIIGFGRIMSGLAVGRAGGDVFMHTARAIILGAVAHMLATNTLIGVNGMIIWGFVGLFIAGRLHHYQNSSGGRQVSTRLPNRT